MTSYQRWGPFLVVVPKSQILSWVFTFEHHCPNLRVLPYCGGAADRALLRSYLAPDELYTARSGVHIFVTSYNVMQCDIEHLRQVRKCFVFLWQSTLCNGGSNWLDSLAIDGAR